MTLSPGWAVPPTPGLSIHEEESLRAAEDYIRNAISVRAYRTSSQTIGAGMTTAVVWQATVEDTSGFWQPGQSRLVVPPAVAGWYLISCGIYGPSSDENMHAALFWNGAQRNRVDIPLGVGFAVDPHYQAQSATMFLMLPLLGEDYIEVFITNSGATSSPIAGGDFRTYLAMRRLV